MTPQCFLVRPARPGSDRAAWHAEARRHAERAGYFINTIESRELPVLPDKGRRIHVLRPEDASYLYRRLHVAPTLVVSVGSSLVSTDPTRDPPNRRATCSLEEFVAYKACYGLVRGSADVVDLFARFAQWAASVDCDGPGDPRVLPFHVFDRGSTIFDLASAGGKRGFRLHFGSSRDRTDESDRRWKSGAPHGRDVARVAGVDLPAGTHWDVSSAARSFRLVSLSGVWEVKPPGYLNVYPDERVRGPGGKYRRQVRKRWPRKNAPH